MPGKVKRGGHFVGLKEAAEMLGQGHGVNTVRMLIKSGYLRGYLMTVMGDHRVQTVTTAGDIQEYVDYIRGTKSPLDEAARPVKVVPITEEILALPGTEAKSVKPKRGRPRACASSAVAAAPGLSQATHTEV